MKKTFLQARGEISKALHDRGWALSSPLKVPYATSPSGQLRLWFKAQAVYFTESTAGSHSFSSARTIAYDLDIRKMSADAFVQHVERWFSRHHMGVARDADDHRFQMPGGLELTPEEMARMKKSYRRASKLRALRVGHRTASGQFQVPKGVRDPIRGRYEVRGADGRWQMRTDKLSAAKQWVDTNKLGGYASDVIDLKTGRWIYPKQARAHDPLRRQRRRRDPNNPDDQLGLPFGGRVTDVLGRRRHIEKRWPDGSYNCPFCFAAVDGGGACQNPACLANPHYPVARAREDVARAEARHREEVERKENSKRQEKYREERRHEEEKRTQEILAEARKRGACIHCLDLRRPKFVKHRKACPKQGRDPEVRSSRGSDLRAFASQVRVFLFAKGLPKSSVIAAVERAHATVFDAWRNRASPKAVADRLYPALAREGARETRRDPRRKKRKVRRRR